MLLPVCLLHFLSALPSLSISSWCSSFLCIYLPCSPDTNDVELGQISQVESTVLYNIPLTSDTSCKLQSSQATHTSDQPPTNLELPTTSPGSIICQNDSENSGKHYTQDYNFIIEHTNQNQPNEETHRVRSERIDLIKGEKPTILLFTVWLIPHFYNKKSSSDIVQIAPVGVKKKQTLKYIVYL